MSKEPAGENKVIGLGSRFRALTTGLFMTLLPLVFVFVGGWATYTGVHQFLTWQAVTGTVTAVEGAGPEADQVTVTYRFTRDGREYTGKVSAKYKEADFAKFQQYKAGQQITVYCNPAKPEESAATLGQRTMGLVFLTFALPFLALGLNMLWAGLTGRYLVGVRSPNAQSTPVPGGGFFWVFTAVCVLGTVGQVAVSILAPWPLDLAGGLAMIFGGIPAVMWWAVRFARVRRARREASGETAPTDAGDAGLPQVPPSLWRTLGPALGFAVFWCGITGVFAYFAVGNVFKQAYAKQHFASTQGVVIVSKVRSDSTTKGTHYAPDIRYKYSVDGHEYVGTQYAFGDGSSSDSSYASAAVTKFPKDRRITVYYDPQSPSRAILKLDSPPQQYFVLLFLQPFLLVGLMLICWCFSLPFSHRRLKRFRDGPADLPWNIPAWGVMRQDFAGIVIRSRGNPLAPLGYFAAAYGVSSFLATFVVAFGFHGFGNADPNAIRWAFILSAAAGALAMLAKLVGLFRSARVTVDTTSRRLSVQSSRRDLSVPTGEIAAWQMRQIPYARGIQVYGESIKYLLLEAVTKSEQAVPVHAFRWAPAPNNVALLVAGRVARELAALTHSAVREKVVAPEKERTREKFNDLV